MKFFGAVKRAEMHLNKYGQIAFQQWEALSHRFRHIRLDEYVVMPNHFHGILVITDQSKGAAEYYAQHVEPASCCAPTSTRCATTSPTPPTSIHNLDSTPSQVVAGSLGAIVRAYKSAVTYRIHGMRGTNGLPVWHRNYYEHIIRNDAELAQIRTYIQTNPLRWDADQLHPSAPANRFNQEK
jgi:putative transposase